MTGDGIFSVGGLKYETPLSVMSDPIPAQPSAQIYTCTDKSCTKAGKTFTLAEMGVRKTGEVSNKCKHHFDLQAAAEARRAPRPDHVHIRTPEERAAYAMTNPTKSAEYSARFREKAGDDFKAKEAARQRERRAKLKQLANAPVQISTPPQ